MALVLQKQPRKTSVNQLHQPDWQSNLTTDSCLFPDSKVDGAHLGPTRWAPCEPNEPSFLGYTRGSI